MSFIWLTSSHFVMLGLLFGFAIAHSGLASLRPWVEKYTGARIYRILFAAVSLPLATVLIIYFINHRYDGLQLWQVQGIPGIQTVVWVLSAISFLFLYPATFNLLEIAGLAWRSPFSIPLWCSIWKCQRAYFYYSISGDYSTETNIKVARVFTPCLSGCCRLYPAFVVVSSALSSSNE